MSCDLWLQDEGERKDVWKRNTPEYSWLKYTIYNDGYMEKQLLQFKYNSRFMNRTFVW